MLDLCLKYDVKLLAFGTLAGGFLTEAWLDKPEPKIEKLETWSQMKYKRFIDIACYWDNFQGLLKSVHGIAQNHQVTMANVASRYILQQPAVGAIIIGARLGESEHIENNLQLFDFSLDDDTMKEISVAINTFNHIPGDCGDEYRKPPFLTATGDLSHHLGSIPAPYYPQTESGGKTKVMTGTVWENMAGFSRAVRKGNRIMVSGTTATHGNKVIGGNDPAAQAHFIIDKIEGVLQSLGSKLEDVIRTRIYIRNISDWEPVALVHGERFKDIQPANTLIKAEIVGEEYLVEIEAEAEVSD